MQFLWSRRSPFPFTGSIAKVTFHLEPLKMSAADRKTFNEVSATAAAGIQ
ncbi:MAG TPA: hypothetical protein VKG44_03870 [Candidatus Baltobacteraceae bacterium]|nr:hypothetical protein [Candidatus Baltobacteraceae bacterium]